MEKELEIATKMQLCQTSAKKLHQDQYLERIEGYIEMIQRYMNLKKCEILDAVIEICHFPDLRNDEYALMMFMAAGCELIEKENPIITVIDNEPLLIKPYAIHGRDELYDLRYSGLTKRQRNAVIVPVRTEPKINRNQPCPCVSGKKYKQCCALVKN
jgi:hypothetical protein